MELVPAETLVKSKSSNSAITKLGTKSRKTSRSNAEFKNMRSKKRGVYVEKWANPKILHAEDNKKQARVRALLKSRIETTEPTSDIEEAKLSSFTRLLSSPHPALTKELYKPLSKTKTLTPTSGFPKQKSNMSNMVSTNKNQYDIKPQRNIIERNKNQVKTKKFKSNVLKQAYAKNTEKVITFKPKNDVMLTSSNTSKLTRELSDDAHWSRIFPSDPQSNADKTQQQNYATNNYESTIRKPPDDNKAIVNRKKSDDETKGGKDENMYNFFIDLLETVYDDKFDKGSAPTLTIVHSGDSSQINLEIAESVAQKLYSTEQKEKDMNNPTMMQHSNRYTIKDDDNDSADADQSQMLADYYNSRAPLIRQKTIRRPRKLTFNKTFMYSPKSDFTKAEAEVKKKKPKKPNLLSLLKEQLSMDVNTYEEPENMYEALCTIARNKTKYRQIRFDTPGKESNSDYEGVCRFKRRKVISPSTRLPRKANVLRSEYDSNNTSGGRFMLHGSVASMNTESNHSLEVYGFDYEETSNVEPEFDSEYWDSDRKTSKYVRSITHLNQGMKTITQYWKQ